MLMWLWPLLLLIRAACVHSHGFMCVLCLLLILTALYSSEGRHLSEITGVLKRLLEKHPQQSPHWNKFASMKKEKEDGAHLGSLEWKEILVDVWNNMYDVHGNLDLGTRTAEPYDIETGQELLLHHGLQDVTGFGEYLKEWKEQDAHVKACIEQRVTVDAATADLGQWLADYCHTEFQLRISALPEFQLKKKNVRYKVLHNSRYKNLANHVYIVVAEVLPDWKARNDESTGNLFDPPQYLSSSARSTAMF